MSGPYIAVTEGGGRELGAVTDYADYLIRVGRDHDGPLFNADGEEVCTMRFTLKTPPAARPTPEQLAMAGARRDVCAGCPAHADLTDTTVTCRQRRACRSRYDLTDPGLECPRGLWPQPEKAPGPAAG